MNAHAYLLMDNDSAEQRVTSLLVDNVHLLSPAESALHLICSATVGKKSNSFKFQFQDCDFKLQLQVAVSSCTFKFQLQVSVSRFSFKFQLQVPFFFN